MDPYTQLEKRVAQLGNHHYKYLHTIRKYKDKLLAAIRSSGSSIKIHLWRSSFSPTDEMDFIRRLSDDVATSVHFISCYYALQFLSMNFRNLDILDMGLAAGANPTKVYHHFMMQLGADFRDLTRAYFHNLLEIYLKNEEKPDFFLSSVGTRADQDDIDALIVVDEKVDKDNFEKVIKRIAQNMLVYATPLHLYLSENIGGHKYLLTLGELDDYLSAQIRDVVIITELLNASFILGNRELFDDFERRIVDRYYRHEEHEKSHYHEGFIRGILGEARRIIVTPPYSDAICPKDDALRLLKSIIFAKKSIYSIRKYNAWDILQELMELEPERKSDYSLLFKALAFIETFKFLLQLFLVQEEYFRLNEFDESQLILIAERMGYSPIGTVSAWDRLIIDYYRYVTEIRRICDELLTDLSRYLSKISQFRRIIQSDRFRDELGRYRGSLPVDFINAARFFTGVKYWDDILYMLEEDDTILMDFIDGLNLLTPDHQKQVIHEYMEWSQYSPITIIRLITIIARKLSHYSDQTLTRKLNSAFLNYIKKIPYITIRFCRIYSRFPNYIHDYLQYLSPEEIGLFLQIMDTKLVDSNLENLRLHLIELSNIHLNSSSYFKRFFLRFTSNHPEYVKSLTEPAQLAKIANGILATVDIMATPSEKKRAIGDYYDIEFMRIGINAMRGVDLYTINREFTTFSDNYMQKLFDICLEEMRGDRPDDMVLMDNFAILAAGGHGREQAFDDDFDLIAIIDTEDQETIRSATTIVARMNREIIRRGILTHYRLGDILGGFVNTLQELEAYLSSGDDESFIDLSQLLGARMIIGSDYMKSRLHERILKQFVFDNKGVYIRRMVREIESRHEYEAEREEGVINIKEEGGGLRDLEAIALMLKSFLESDLSISQDFFQIVRSRFGDLSAPLGVLDESLYFLRSLRDLYRLTVAAEDEIEVEQLERVARVFKHSIHPEWSSREDLQQQIELNLKKSARACDEVIAYLLEKV